MISTRKMHTQPELLLAAMTTLQIARLIDQIQLVLIPFGATEMHGERLVLGADSFIADAFCREVSRQLYPRVVVAPTIRWAPRGRGEGAPGTISLNESTLLHIFEDVADSLALHGMSRFLILTTHTASQDSAKQIANILSDREGVAIANAVNLSELIDKKIISKGIGWDKFSDMAQKSFIKIYAIGGLSNDDLEVASKHYACGIAGISMFNQSS